LNKSTVLFIGKSPSPPFNDSNKIIVKNLLSNISNVNIEYLSDGKLNYPNKKERIVYNENSSYNLTLKQQAKVFLDLLKPNLNIDIYHYFFAPNFKTSLFCRLLKMAKPKYSIQSVLSMPKTLENPEILFFGDLIITKSRSSQKILENVGVSNVKTIYPGIEIKDLNKDEINTAKNYFKLDIEKGAVLYAGDYNEDVLKLLDVAKYIYNQYRFIFVFAIRLKDEASKEFDKKFRETVKKLNLPSDYIRIYNEVENFDKLLQASDIVIFSQKDLYAKMDIPLVLLEAMAYKKLIISSKLPSLFELNKNDNILFADNEKDIFDLLSQINQHVKAEFGLKNIQVVRNYFEASIMAKQYEKIYENIN